jgi:Skp family chaperone for outer membrane proteins
VDLAGKTLDQARAAYEAGDTAHGDEELDLVAKLAEECLSATQESHKARYWKRAELKVAALARRVRSLTEDLNYDRRDKAQELASELDAIHEKLLAGVMGK